MSDFIVESTFDFIPCLGVLRVEVLYVVIEYRSYQVVNTTALMRVSLTPQI